MSLRDEFEKLWPLPTHLEYHEESNTYCIKAGFDRSSNQLLRSCDLYSGYYQGFLLGRRNTVSVERYKQHVEDAYNEAAMDSGADQRHMDKAWEVSGAKRRTEEV